MIKQYLKLMRFHQPTGIFLLLWPCLISLSMASYGKLDIKLTLVFIIGSILMRSAGCIINDMIDYNIDSKVFRTKTRPLTDGKISFSQAKITLFSLLGLSATLLLLLNKLAAIIALSSIIIVIIYPFCKRFTHWAQLILGIVYNIGVLVAWAAVKGEIHLPAILLYIGCICWTIGYDTIYAYQDLQDDLKLGLKSTAIKFGDQAEKYLNYFYTIAATMFVFSGNIAKVGMRYNLLTILPIIILFWQIRTLEINDRDNCSLRFKSNVLVGGLLFLATLFGKSF